MPGQRSEYLFRRAKHKATGRTGLIQDGNEKGEVIWMLSDMINARLEEGRN